MLSAPRYIHSSLLVGVACGKNDEDIVSKGEMPIGHTAVRLGKVRHQTQQPALQSSQMSPGRHVLG